MRKGILSGLRVIDAASFIAAPVAATVMADFGADVIKIENPAGDTYRGLTNGPGLPPIEHPFHWHLTNHNKRSVALDLRKPDGYAVLTTLVRDADVFITNFPGPQRRRLKLEWSDLKDINPRLVYACLSAYGEDGPEADRPGFDSTAYWARSGLMHAVRPDPDGGPARSMPGQGDHPTGIALFGAIMLALYERQQTGKGAKVHTSLMANGVFANGYAAQAALAGSSMPTRPAREHMSNALTNHYRCADGRWFILSVLNQERDWPRLVEATGADHLLDDPRFRDEASRTQHAFELCAELDAIFSRRDLAHWRHELGVAGVILGVVGTSDGIVDDEQARACGALRDVAPDVQPAFGASSLVDTPVFVDSTEKVAPTPAPECGAHTREVLREVGFSDADIDALARSGTFGGG